MNLKPWSSFWVKQTFCFSHQTKHLIDLHKTPHKGRADAQDGGGRASPAPAVPLPNALGLQWDVDPLHHCHTLLNCLAEGHPAPGEDSAQSTALWAPCPHTSFPLFESNVQWTLFTTKNKRTLFFLFIPNDKQRGSFIFSSHVINQTIPSLRWPHRGSLSALSALHKSLWSDPSRDAAGRAGPVTCVMVQWHGCLLVSYWPLGAASVTRKVVAALAGWGWRLPLTQKPF